MRLQPSKLLIATVFTLSCAGFSSAASAQDLVYTPINPSAGGNAFNSSHLLAIANAQNSYERPAAEASSQDDLDRFIRSLQGRLLSSLSTQVSNAIFGDDAQDNGTIVFGDQTISFVRGLDGIKLTIIDGDGAETVITVPTLITDSGASIGDSLLTGGTISAAPLQTPDPLAGLSTQTIQ